MSTFLGRPRLRFCGSSPAIGSGFFRGLPRFFLGASLVAAPTVLVEAFFSASVFLGRPRFFGVFFETAVIFLILAAAGLPTVVFRGLLGFFLGVGFLVAAFLGMAVFDFTVPDFFGWALFFGAFAAIFFLVGI